MKRCQICAGYAPPVTVIGVCGGSHRDQLAVGAERREADPHRGGELRRVAGEPGVLVLVGRCRSCRRPGRSSLARVPVPRSIDLLEDARERVDHPGLEHLRLLVLLGEEHRAVGARDAGDQHRRHPDPAVGEGGVGGGHVHGGDLVAPEHAGGHVLERAHDPVAGGALHRLLGADPHDELRVERVVRADRALGDGRPCRRRRRRSCTGRHGGRCRQGC